MNNRNIRVNDVVDTRQINRNLNFADWTSGIIFCEMRCILMSILLISLLLKVVFSNVSGMIFGLGSIRRVFI